MLKPSRHLLSVEVENRCGDAFKTLKLLNESFSTGHSEATAVSSCDFKDEGRKGLLYISASTWTEYGPISSQEKDKNSK